MLNNGLNKRLLPQSDGTAARRGLSSSTAFFLGLGLIVPACSLTWLALKWERLDARATRAEAELADTQKELADHTRRAAGLRDIEASLRQEMSQLNSLVGPHDRGGIGVSRGTLADVFDDLQLVNKDELAREGSKHYAIESLAGSIQLRGPPSDLTQIKFFGVLQGANSEASTNMLVRLLSTVAPHWEATHRASWLAKVANIEDEILVYKDIGRLRLEWHWTGLDGVRIDVLSIAPK